MNELEINLKAAKMLGKETTVRGADVWVMKPSLFKSGYVLDTSFNLFTNDSDLVAVVKMFGEKHGVAFRFDRYQKKWTAVFHYGLVLIVGDYEQTVGAAVEAL